MVAPKKAHDLISGKGIFERAVSSLCLLKKGGIKTAVMNVFHRKNYKEIPLLIGLCDKLEVDALGITELVPIGRGSEIRSLSLNPLEVKELFMQIAKKQADLINKNKKLRIDMKRPLWVLIKNEFPELKNMIGGGCAAGFSGLAMLPNGDIMPCRRMCYTIGNIKEQTFFEIWYSSNVLWELRERDKLGECANCENNKFCGGCKAVSLASKGSYLKTDPQCWFKYGAV